MAKHIGMQCGVTFDLSFLPLPPLFLSFLMGIAMNAAQSRIGETLEVFYGAADRASEGAMAGHAYKRSVDELDTSFTRELVCCPTIYFTPHNPSLVIYSRMVLIAPQFLNHWGKCVLTSQL